MINMPIDMIFETDKSGHIKPIRMRVEEDESYIVYDVQSFMLKEVTKLYQVFYCRVIDQGCVKTFVLRFYMMEAKWVLFGVN